MLKKITLKNFTVFNEAEFNFSPGINIIIGENASGKSHLLKLGYSIAAVWDKCGQEGTKQRLKSKLNKVFKVEKPGDLRSLNNKNQDNQTRLTLEFSVNHKNKDSEILDFSLGPDSLIVHQHPHAPLLKSPLFFPAKEVLSLFTNFITLYEKYQLSFDETYYDLCKALDNPLLKEPNQALIEAIEAIIGGKFVLKADDFYLQTEQGDINIFMVAEGWRKLGMLSYLIANDSLKEDSILFWDEPETNLNPRLIKQLATVLVALANHNIQVVIATHNLFLMKYFDYLIANSKTNIQAKFFSLAHSEQGISIEQGTRLNHLQTIVALEEELELYDKEQQTLYANL